MILPHKLHRSYGELTTLLEHMPNGLPWDEIQSKVSSIKNLRRNEATQLMEYIVQDNRIEVTDVTRKGDTATALLRHRKFGEALKSVQQPGITGGENVVWSATPGKLTLPSNLAKLPLVDTAPLHITPNPRIDSGRPVLQAAYAALTEPLRKAAKAIVEYIATRTDGVTRTDLNNKSMAYHGLTGKERTLVIAAIVGAGEVFERHPGDESDKRTARVLVHIKYAQPLEVSEQKFDHDAPTLSLDPIVAVTEPAVTANSKDDHVAFNGGAVDDDVEDAFDEPVLSLHEVMDVAYKVQAFVKMAGRGGMSVARLHHLCTEYHELNRTDRRRVMRYLVDVGAVSNFTKGTTLHVEIINPLPRDVKPAINKTVTTPPTVPETTTTPEVNMTQKTAEPTIESPSETSSAADIRAKAMNLLAQAEKMERQNNEMALVELIRPVYKDLRTEYETSQALLEQQIESLASMGLLLERLNQLLED